MSNNDQFTGVSDCPKEQEFECPECGAVFNYPGHLNPLESYREHFEEEHPEKDFVTAAFLAEGPHDFYQCKTCGERFNTKAEREAHSHSDSDSRKPLRSRKPTVAGSNATKKAAGATKKAGRATKTGGIASLKYLFDEQGEIVALGWGVFLGMYWGHSPGQAYTLILATAGGGLASHEITRKFPADTERIVRQIQRNLLQCGLGLVGAALVIKGMHTSVLDAPVSIPYFDELPDWLVHMFDSHNH